MGPRESGKTTLVKDLFKEKPYVSLENPENRKSALEDLRGFLERYPVGAIFDEVQRTPDIFSSYNGKETP
ncbi:MAG: AAA family ATPase [Bacteroidota bacterium]|nr:AAA family ATPase [Bacteroidota bacterium]